MHLATRTISAAIVLAAVLSGLPTAWAISVDEALQLSQKTGRPILAMVGSKDCGACIALEKRLNADSQAQPLIANFIPLKIDQGTPDWQAWGSRFESTGATIPKVFVVRADGQQLFGQSATLPGSELTSFLTQMLAQSGAPLAERQIEQMESALIAANKLLNEQQVEKAVQAIAPCLGSGSYASAAVEIEKLGQRMVDEALAAAKSAEAKLASDDESFAGALELLALERTHAKLPAAVEAIRDILKQHRRDSDLKDAFSQAQAADRAKALEDKKQEKRAMAAYEALAARYEGQPAGEYADERIAALESSGVPRSGAASAARPSAPSGAAVASSDRPVKPAASSDAKLKKAVSLLNQGKNLLAKNPDRARQYLDQVIELAPGSEPALDARDLLESLR